MKPGHRPHAACAAALLALATFAPDALAQGAPIRFQGGIGSQPLRTATAGNPAVAASNDAFGVNPGGRPWVIAELHADLRADGRIRADGRGLLLAGGDATGTRGAIEVVRARAACVIPGTPVTYQYFDSAPVPLDANGDFRVDGTLTPVTPGTSLCANPGLLIVNGGSTAWFAAGIPKR